MKTRGMTAINENKPHRGTGCGGLAIMPVLLLLAAAPVMSQVDTISGGKNNVYHDDHSLFSGEEMLDVTLSLDLARFTKKPSKTDTFDADITIRFSETDSLARPVTIKYRGISRYAICSFPPMQLNFRKPVTIDSVKVRKLKLVTHCQASTINDEYVIREYLVYKLYNALTDTSFRVRLLKISYVDSKMNKRTIRKYGIFIEPSDILAKRINAVPIKTGIIYQSHIIPSVMDRVAIFNYLVSNWDWSIPGQHNVQVFKPLEYSNEGNSIAVPYDFDLTGVVNADYAIPPPAMEIENVRQPVFNGMCRTRDVYQQDLNKFAGAKDSLYSLVNGFPHLSQRAKKDILTFLDNFYDQLRKQKSTDYLIDAFLSTCKR